MAKTITIKKNLPLDLTIEQLEGIEADMEELVNKKGYTVDDIVDYNVKINCLAIIKVKRTKGKKQ